MFDSTQEILEQYLDKANRFTIRSIDVQRGQNPEDVFYLCHVDKDWYVVYETDFVDTGKGLVDEIRERFIDIEPLYWLIKKVHATETIQHHLSLNTQLDNDHDYNLLVSKGTYLRFAVLSVALRDTKDGERFHPGKYGGYEN